MHQSLPQNFIVSFLAPLTIVRRSLSDTNLSVVRHPSAYVNFFKLLLLLHFSMDSFETRYTYFLGQSPNFVLFRILKFGFSDLLWIFIKLSLKSLLLLQFLVDSLETMYTYYLCQSSHLFLFSFWNLHFLYFSWIFIKFSLKSLLILQFPMDSFATRYTYSLGQCSHLLRRFFEICIFFIFWPNFHPSFIQIATAPTIFNGFLWNSHGEDGLSCRPCLKFSGAI